MRWLMRAHSCKRPAPVTTTYSNFRGGRLRERRLHIFPESLLNIDYIVDFCFNYIDHNKQRQHIFCDHDVGQL